MSDVPFTGFLIGMAVLTSVALIWAAIETARAMRSLRATSEELREKGAPVLEKSDVVIDAVSAELLRIDTAISRFEEASVRVSAASGTLTEIVQAPAEIVTGVAGRVRRAWKERKRSSDVTEEPRVTEPTDVPPSPPATASPVEQDGPSPEQAAPTVRPEDVDLSD